MSCEDCLDCNDVKYQVGRSEVKQQYAKPVLNEMPLQLGVYGSYNGGDTYSVLPINEGIKPGPDSYKF